MRSIDGIVSFSNEDNQELDHPHEDALLLSLTDGNFLIRRVMIDAKSVVDLIHQPMLVQMGYQTAALHSPNKILIG